MRERVGAVVIDKDKIILLKREKDDRTYWVFPGGGVDEGENRKEALVRECKEELGLDVEVGEMIFRQRFDFCEVKGQYRNRLGWKCNCYIL